MSLTWTVMFCTNSDLREYNDGAKRAPRRGEQGRR